MPSMDWGVGLVEGIPLAGGRSWTRRFAGGATSKDQYRVKNEYLVEKG